MNAAMEGFKTTAGIPHCVRAIDGPHIAWLVCPSEYFDYWCYKEFTTVVIFTCSTADRRFTFIDVRRPWVLGDSKIFEESALKWNIDTGPWLQDNVPSLSIAGVDVCPYLIGDCAFSLL